MADASLYERIGGKNAVKATVVRLYEKILEDEKLIPFFEHIDMDTLRRSQSAFIVMAFGGPHQYTGKDLRTAHAPMVAQGLSDVHFDAVATHLAEAMRELGVKEELIQEALAIVSTTRNDVLNKVAS